MSWNHRVFSSNVESIGWDSDSEEIIVYWNSGKVSAYSGGNEGLAEAAANAASVGSFVNSEIKPSLSHRYI